MRGVNLRPCFDDGDDLVWSEVGKSKVVLGREGKDEAFSCYCFGS